EGILEGEVMVPRSGKPVVADLALDPDPAEPLFEVLAEEGGDPRDGMDVVAHHSPGEPPRIFRIACAMSGAPYSAVPATMTLAPWAAAMRAVRWSIPPSTSICQARS